MSTANCQELRKRLLEDNGGKGRSLKGQGTVGHIGRTSWEEELFSERGRRKERVK